MSIFNNKDLLLYSPLTIEGYPAYKHFLKLIFSNQYRKKYFDLKELRSVPRYSDGKSEVLGSPVKFVDASSFLYSYIEIFLKQILKFTSKSKSPYIVDCGSNVGLTVSYFKGIFPKAEIVAFEADKKIFDVLAFNIQSLQLEGVTLINKAVWNCETNLLFFSEGADAGRIALESDRANVDYVPAVSLRAFLDRDVDFLKIDIEGAETVVLNDCKDLLGNVKNIFIEYHSFPDRAQTLDEILLILKGAGFRYFIQQHGSFNVHPFCERWQDSEIDLMLNIYGYRD